MKTKKPHLLGTWNFEMKKADAKKIRAHIEAKGIKQGPFFAQAALEKIQRETKEAA